MPESLIGDTSGDTFGRNANVAKEAIIQLHNISTVHPTLDGFYTIHLTNIMEKFHDIFISHTKCIDSTPMDVLTVESKPNRFINDSYQILVDEVH